MNDPWEGIRHTLSVMPAQSLISDPIMGFLVADAKKLLADADGLLWFKQDITLMLRQILTNPTENNTYYLHQLDRRLATLPDYLKGE